MILKWHVFLSLVSFSFSYRIREGSLCDLKIANRSFPGQCKPIYKCNYAMTLLYKDEKKPPMCGWDDDIRIVCCPTGKNFGFRTGIFGRLYDPASDGVKRSEAVTCRYDGSQHQCCPNKPDVPLPAETGCPPLDIPRSPNHLTAVERIAWHKCVETQRFVYKCVAKKDDSEWLIRENTCGIPKDRFRISGGNPAESKEFPHMAVLGVLNSGNSTDDVDWVGGGALISDRMILTAAHVLVDPSSRPLRYALLGALNKTDVLSGLLFNIVRKIAHPYYDHNRVHDIALVELDRRVTFSEFVRPICLPVPGQEVHSSTVRDIAGWGRTGENADPSQLLLTTQVYLEEDDSECKRKFETLKFHFNSTTMMCARGKLRDKLGSDSCHGDSGGPLMALLDNIYCSYSVEGVVSFGPRCGEGSAGIYTRVAPYLPWIVKNTWPQEWARATGAGAFD